MSAKISIIGASGYTGGELLRILSNHPKAEVIGAYGKTTAGKKVKELHPNLAGIDDFTIEEPDYEEIGSDSDLVFSATPHGTAMSFVPKLLDAGAKVVDLSADYRLDEIETYEEYYRDHESPGLKSVYGIPELYRDEIKESKLVANPGCYPTAAILSLAPLLKEGLVDSKRVVIDSKSGTSGAGAKPSEKLHHPVCADNMRPYKATSHRHAPEIKQEAGKIAGEEVETYFTPHLTPMVRGILNTSHVFLKDSKDESELEDIYKEFYDGETFVRLTENLPQTNSVRGSNFCDIKIEKSQKSERATAISAIDNLVKGASGQAVQNMNLMFDLPEDMGLRLSGLRP